MKKMGELVVGAEMRKEDSEVPGRGHKGLEFPADVDTRTVGVRVAARTRWLSVAGFCPVTKTQSIVRKKRRRRLKSTNWLLQE